MSDQLCVRLGIDVPVYQAGMGGVAGPELAAGVSNAGGLGHLGCIRRSAEDTRAWIREAKALTDKPFGVNLVPPGGGVDGFEAQLAVVLEEKPAVLSLFWGEFSDAISRAHDAGIVTMVQIGSADEAKRAADAGADVLIAQGTEAGGHVRGESKLADLLGRVIEAVAPLPVLAGGGLSTADDVSAVMRNGAAGPWVGTRFIATQEAFAHPIYKQRLVEGHGVDTHHARAYSYGWPFGTPYRTLRSRRYWDPLRWVNGGVRPHDKDSYARRFSLYCGSGVDAIDDIPTAAEIVARLTPESSDV
jgi:NAD(P)H-dependent flavin oxidoreductase YrpB (nitropropane dioxygenase family)